MNRMGLARAHFSRGNCPRTSLADDFFARLSPLIEGGAERGSTKGKQFRARLRRFFHFSNL